MFEKPQTKFVDFYKRTVIKRRKENTIATFNHPVHETDPTDPDFELKWQKENILMNAKKKESLLLGYRC